MELQTFLEEVLAFAKGKDNSAGYVLTGVRHMGIFQSDQPKSKTCALYEPIVSLILQGRKEAYVGDRHLSYGAGDLLIVGHTMPVLSAVIDASPEAPYAAIFVAIDHVVLQSLYNDIAGDTWPNTLPRGVEAGLADDALVQAMARLFELHRDPAEEQALGAARLREVYYRVLRSRHAGALRDIVKTDSKSSRVAKAIAHVQQEFRSQIKAADLAEIAGMSVSVFYESFRQVTDSTPLQFQKDLRLLDAHNQLHRDRTKISEIAFSVGYESPAQFSREYTRKFGVTPRQERLNAARGVQPDVPWPAGLSQPRT